MHRSALPAAPLHCCHSVLQVRLYNEKTLTQAKTSIPGMGLPITNVDVTFDGGWGRGEGAATQHRDGVRGGFRQHGASLESWCWMA